jgi:hypothetical protein
MRACLLTAVRNAAAMLADWFVLRSVLFSQQSCNAVRHADEGLTKLRSTDLVGLNMSIRAFDCIIVVHFAVQGSFLDDDDG